MSKKSKKVFVVGAGPCGLAAVKEMKEAGHEVIAVDCATTIGGVFGGSAGIAYEELYLTTSNVFTSFSDFPPKLPVRYFTKDEYAAYLEAYATHFDLLPFIKLETTVEKASLVCDGTWRIRTVGPKGTEEVHRADYLIVASGSNRTAAIPEFEEFTGDVVHSSAYDNSTPFAGKSVLVVGVGESASDIAYQCGKVCKSVHVYARKPFVCGPRFANFDQTRHEPDVLRSDDRNKMTVTNMLESVIISRWYQAAPASFVSWRLQKVWDRELTSKSPHWRLAAELAKDATAMDYYMADLSQAVTKTWYILSCCERGTVSLVVAPTMTFDGRRVQFDKPSFVGCGRSDLPSLTIDVDVVIACTGYKTKLPWLDIDVSMNPRHWYKHCFPPGFEDKMCFLGWARPQQGGIPPCAEMLARYTALLLSGLRQLPHDCRLRAVQEGAEEDAFFHRSPRLKSLVYYNSFINSVARLVGCEPNISILNPMLFLKTWFLPAWPVFYRLNGPGANRAAVFSLLDQLPTNPRVSAEVTWINVVANAAAWPINGIYYVLRPLLTMGNKQPLHRWWRHLPTRFYLLNGNHLRMRDFFRFPESGIAGLIMLPLALIAVMFFGSKSRTLKQLLK
eukprot:NODE_773_length_2107_cov_125.552419_g735_i0.p1 GENE.NODE_773_length_2107_cov_125.552419_g735_i0~~NODE_773_length_2107_cov_125.552419_g735_i0.p1  ORF type:complete len:635 (-),score=96.49 NODE_773_length_2107_cov_125.552419_g735_i0:203-2053(-)